MPTVIATTGVLSSLVEENFTNCYKERKNIVGFFFNHLQPPKQRT